MGMVVMQGKMEDAEMEGRGSKSARPIDLVHLAKQTLGDRSLETEVLRLFLAQADIYIGRIEKADTLEERFEAAHTIKGSARNIGAWHVAGAAENLEKLSSKVGQPDIEALKNALRETRKFISSLLDES